MHTRKLKKHALKLRRDFTQNSEIDQINTIRKTCESRDQNPNPEVVIKGKFCSCKPNNGIVQHIVKFTITVDARVIFLNVTLKRKTCIH